MAEAALINQIQTSLVSLSASLSFSFFSLSLATNGTNMLQKLFPKAVAARKTSLFLCRLGGSSPIQVQNEA